ncbi:MULTISPECIES: prenyltransferase/squalene oxidase repeat-containing protein [unclassified Imperialibacter]|uniref:prenyltransferase/squalene oxidase repeat-containing protein n=1 Tax=unclassified Imperialibacter TaxID=2629706 RepID=UPI001258A285|nr:MULTISPECIES: prenyltransferase/squalene oxidase repeat-containing protein [unclassified Imperialibacter]CAD5265181.1 conserved hypothetical protein [Imperialibacter sp. 89]CAD5270060.1 conserved hypothetical protein [Imperialibacter sp. 75]VVT09675.1 conserved hypothetical protein [Imperialibacter sp. EC-SDR9]
MNKSPVIQWLMEGDVAIQYQVSRDLLGANTRAANALQKRIESEGWGARFLQKQLVNGHWGQAFYQPKWASTHYTLLDLKTIGLWPLHAQAQRGCELALGMPSGENGGLRCSATSKVSDVCVNGMILNYGSYFLPGHQRLKEVVDYLLKVQMADGGWNCRYLHKDTTHSSLHSTLSVLEGLLEFRKPPEDYRTPEIIQAEQKAVEFLLRHHLYQSHRTGEIIDQRMLRLSFPGRWRYDILRALDHLRNAAVPYEPRMKSALDILKSKRKKDGAWRLQEKHKGNVHFDMEKTGSPSRWNTLRALRVLNWFQPGYAM